MKVCEKCGCEEVGGKDSDISCASCEDLEMKGKRNARARANRHVRESIFRELGLVKVRGALGGIYWE